MLNTPIIDEQDRSIVAMINTLFYFSQYGKKDDLIVPVLDTFEQYAKLISP